MFGYDIENKDNVIFEESSGPMDSPWPMYGHDARHTGRSPYSSENCNGIEKWRINIPFTLDSSPAIDIDGTIYFGALSYSDQFYAINPDGTIKWKLNVYEYTIMTSTTPAIAEDGTIYFATSNNHVYAVNPNGTLKWKFDTGEYTSVIRSPVIASDGTIYFGTTHNLLTGEPGNLFALNPDGTEKWRFDDAFAIVCSPAIGYDGTIYFGALDSYVYALNPDGTVSWKYKTNDAFHGSPSIGINGDVYIINDKGILYAFNPNDGLLKWNLNVGSMYASPSIGKDGVLYFATMNNKIYGIFPNGTIKWFIDLGDGHWNKFCSPVISSNDDIIFIIHFDYPNPQQTNFGVYVLCIDKNGNELWRKYLNDCIFESLTPCIAEDGTIYFCSDYFKEFEPYRGNFFGYLHAFGVVESNVPPDKPIITGTTEGKIGEEYIYSIESIDPDRNPVSYYIDWGDGLTNETMEYASAEEVWIWHIYKESGTYTIRVKARDILGEESDWGELTVSMPRYKTTSLLYWFLEDHPRLFPILRQILKT